MPRSKREVESGLCSKGFSRKEGDHHFFIYWTTGGRKSRVFTKTSHSGKEISDDLLSMMARQCKVTRPNFFGLVDCPLSRQDYESLLSQAGWL
jgi:hypothetical protein